MRRSLLLTCCPGSLKSLSCLVFKHRSLSPLLLVSSRFFAAGSCLRVNLSEMPEKKPFSRLPTIVKPTNYDLTLKPNLEAFTFEGVEIISVEVGSPVKDVLVNTCEIEIKSVKFTKQQGDAVVGNVSYNAEDETATLSFPEELQPGSGFLHLEYTGLLNDKMKGFYRSKYTAQSGEERFAAVTQFEATDARRALPCWDEPAVKATFDVTLIVPADRVALSNMPIASQEDLGDGLLKYKFDRTPIMSTYLLAFIVGEFDYIEEKDKDGVVIRVYTPKGKTEQGKFSLEVAVKTLPFYKDYFGIAYPLPKMDLIAIADFASGAMENWGLVTYRETALLVDPQNSSMSSKQWVALVVGHELAHQWFGNLVTMEWWTHLWLNEGFASFIEYLCVDHCFPEFDIWTQFVNQDLARALELDALRNSHPIEVPVGHPDEVDEIFDVISYSKGASVIRMLHDWIGNDAFRTGLNAYLKKFQYQNAVTDDLWDSLAEASGKPVREVMSTWTGQMGFPVLKVSQRQEGSNRILTVEQERFIADGKPSAESMLWKVPVKVSSSESQGQPIASVLMEEARTEIVLEGLGPDAWVKLNPGAVGVYRVCYPTEMLESIITGIASNILPPRDKLGLQNDLFALATAGLVPLTDVLKVVEAYANESNYIVWNDLSTNLAIVKLLSYHLNCHDHYSKYIVALFSGIAAKLGWEKSDVEGPLDSMLRALVLGVLGRAGHEGTVAEARSRFDAHYSGVQSLCADLRGAVYSTVLRHSKELDHFDKLLELFRKADLQEEKVRVLRCLGSGDDAERIKKVLQFSLTDEVRSQDTVFVIASVTESPTGKELAWQFTKDNWELLRTRYEGGFLLSRLVKSVTEDFASEEKALEVEKFFRDHPAPAAERTIQQSCETIRLNAQMLAREGEKLKSFLESRTA